MSMELEVASETGHLRMNLAQSIPDISCLDVASHDSDSIIHRNPPRAFWRYPKGLPLELGALEIPEQIHIAFVRGR